MSSDKAHKGRAKLSADITRSSKYGYQWSHKKNYCSQLKNLYSRKSRVFLTISL